MNTGPLGSELTKEPFRWDQRLFAIVLALPAIASSAVTIGNANSTAGTVLGDAPANQFIPAAIDQPITAMCDVTGGKLKYFRIQISFSFIYLNSRTLLFNYISKNSSPMFGVSCTKNSNWCCC